MTMKLTKREQIAAMCLQGLLSNPENNSNKAEAAIYWADELLKKLNKVPPEKPKGKKYNYEIEDFEIACHMDEKIKELTKSEKETNLDSWANKIRLIRENDSHSVREIYELFDWANRHHFWGSNILCPQKLREKWDRLKLQKEREGEKVIGVSKSRKVSDALDRIAKEDIEKKGFADYVGGGNI